jgi:hypothetical protein
MLWKSLKILKSEKEINFLEAFKTSKQVIFKIVKKINSFEKMNQKNPIKDFSNSMNQIPFTVNVMQDCINYINNNINILNHELSQKIQFTFQGSRQFDETL